ncbi:MAG: murein biosynthesis integral membrane protein MurJ [Deltaproteobacteria bacterium]|nr:murein biosynthesis integral membrane protein MurJ [Deltaproteobacteria bacterium]
MNEKAHKELTKHAGVVAFFTTLSRFTGLARDIVTANLFGANAIMDAFNIAFTIPNTLRRFVAEGALTVAFIPVYTEVRKHEGLEAAKRFYSSVSGILMLTLLALVTLGILGATGLVYAFASGFAERPEQTALTVSLTQWMFGYVFFISLVALSMGVLNAHQHFTVPAASPILLNLSMIACAYGLYHYFEQPVYSLAAGVMLGGVLQLAVQLPVLAKYGLLLRPTLNINSEPVRKLLRLLLPSVFGIAIYQINLMVLRQLGSYLPAGQITCYSMADRLMQLALGIFAISIATATLPAMSEQTASKDDDSHEKLIHTWQFSTRLTNFITIPAAFGLMLIGLPIVSVLFYHGAFDWNDTMLTAYATIAFAPGLITVAFSRTTVQAFYALKDMKTPVAIAGVVLVVNLALGLALLRFQVAGLALSLTLSSFVQTALLLFFLHRKIGNLESSKLLRSMAKQTILALSMGLVAWGICHLGTWYHGPTWQNILTLGFAVLSGIVTYAALSLVFKSSEAVLVKRMLVSKFLK